MARPKKAEPKRGNEPAETVLEVERGTKLTVDQLERYLWSAADILRGSIDSSDYKSYIFGLLFLKRLSDRLRGGVREARWPRASHPIAWRTATITSSSCRSAPAGPRSRRSQPTSARHSTRRARRSKEQNTALEGVLAGIDFNDERKLGDAKNRDAVLARLVQHFSRLNLRNADPLRARHARPGLRVPHREVRRRRGQEGRRVLHAQEGRRTDRRAAGSRKRGCASATRPAARAAC